MKDNFPRRFNRFMNDDLEAGWDQEQSYVKAILMVNIGLCVCTSILFILDDNAPYLSKCCPFA